MEHEGTQFSLPHQPDTAAQPAREMKQARPSDEASLMTELVLHVSRRELWRAPQGTEGEEST